MTMEPRDSLCADRFTRFCSRALPVPQTRGRGSYIRIASSNKESMRSSSSIDQNDTITVVLIGLRDDK